MRLAVVWALLAGIAAADDSLTFAPPPRLATTPAEWAKRKASPDFAAAETLAVQAAGALLKEPVVVPDGAGDWIFYYACPTDGNTLQAVGQDEHACPQCQRVYRDERTLAAYRTRQHDQANQAACQLGWAWWYTSDDRYAAEVQRILLKLADDYAHYPQRRDRWGHTGWLAPLGGRRYSQSLDEAFGIIELAKAYDLTRGAACWSDAQRAHVEADLFRATAATLQVSNLGVSNHQTWFNAGLMAIASVLADRGLVEKVLSMRGGFRDQLDRSVDRDGLWCEGAMAYQNYALHAMIEIVDAGRRLGLPLDQEPKFRLLLRGPLQYAYPDGRFPAINDSDPMGIDAFDWSFRWAAQTYDDWPREPRPAIETRSRNLADAGLAVLRRGQQQQALCAMLDYGPHGGGHGHFDKLALVVFAGGREWLLDPGRLTYSHREYKTWVKHTAAHNTVAINGRSQAATTGKLLWFDVQDGYAACAAQSDQAYPGVVLTRFLLLTDEMLVDLFAVDGPSQAQIDWFAHAICERLEPAADLGAGKPVAVGNTDGYEHLQGAQAWSPGQGSCWNFVAGAGGGKLPVWLAANVPEQVIAATGIGYSVDAKAPCLLRRVAGRSARFATVYDLSAAPAAVSGLALDPADPQRLLIRSTAGKQAVRFSGTGVEYTAAR